MPFPFGRLFDLRHDQDDPQAIDSAVRAGVRFAGTNLWVLFFAILVASVGLNVNSTAVIIGAMLISPLMGPIVGLGYGAAVHDTTLLRQSAQNLAVFTGISLVTSMLYFSLSPLVEPGSELLARTTPTLWDVLIAAFGGAAGMVALTRRGFSNVVPGVAIATALMPPLCTVGFGLAHGRWDMAGGAFFLFLINGVFIASSTLAVSKLVNLPPLGLLDGATVRRHRVFISLGLAVVLLPSIWLGWRFVQQEIFAANAQALLAVVQSDPKHSVVGQSVDRAARHIQVTVVGVEAERLLQTQTAALLGQFQLEDARLEIRRAGSGIDERQLRQSVQRDVARMLGEQLARSESERAALAEALARRAAPPEAGPPVESILAELRAQEPAVLAATLAVGQRATAGAPGPAGTASAPRTGQAATVVVIDLRRPLPLRDRRRLADWLTVRLGRGPVDLIERVVPADR